MSTDAALQGVTQTLCYLLDRGTQLSGSSPIDHVPGTNITTLPPDKAQDGTGKRVNLFLYQVLQNGTWRNMPLPTQVKPGEFGHPPLALDLYYLLTAYDSSDQEADLETQRLLGRAMLIFHDNGLINRSLLEQIFPNSELHKQVEQIKITPMTLSLDEMSKLWTTFQTQYRLSVAYQVSVVLLESKRETRTPLPVLQRGSADQGIISQADLLPPIPTLTKVLIPEKQQSLRLTDGLKIEGHKLKSKTDNKPQIILHHPSLDAPIKIPAGGNSTDKLLEVNLNDPAVASRLAPGFYQVVAEIEDKIIILEGGEEKEKVITRTTNTLTFPLAPTISNVKVTPDPDPTINKRWLTLNVSPPLREGQRVRVLLSSLELAIPDISGPTENLTIDVTNVPEGKYRVRLRVDGVDSHLITDYEAIPLQFDDTFTITIPANE